MSTLGQLVKTWRMASGLTKKALADKVGVNYQDIQNLEGGVQTPRYLPQLAAVMGTSIDALHAGVMPPPLDPKRAHSRPKPVPALRAGPTIGRTIAECLRSAGKLDVHTRDALASLVAGIIKSPEEADRLAGKIDALLSTEQPPSPRESTPGTTYGDPRDTEGQTRSPLEIVEEGIEWTEREYGGEKPATTKDKKAKQQRRPKGDVS